MEKAVLEAVRRAVNQQTFTFVKQVRLPFFNSHPAVHIVVVRSHTCLVCNDVLGVIHFRFHLRIKWFG